MYCINISSKKRKVHLKNMFYSHIPDQLYHIIFQKVLEASITEYVYFILFLALPGDRFDASYIGTASHEAAPSHVDQRTCNGLWPRQTNSSYI